MACGFLSEKLLHICSKSLQECQAPSPRLLLCKAGWDAKSYTPAGLPEESQCISLELPDGHFRTQDFTSISSTHHLLHDQIWREERSKIIGANRLVSPRMQHWRKWLGEISLNVVPSLRHFTFFQHICSSKVQVGYLLIVTYISMPFETTTTLAYCDMIVGIRILINC